MAASAAIQASTPSPVTAHGGQEARRAATRPGQVEGPRRPASAAAGTPVAVLILPPSRALRWLRKVFLLTSRALRWLRKAFLLPARALRWLRKVFLLPSRALDLAAPAGLPPA